MMSRIFNFNWSIWYLPTPDANNGFVVVWWKMMVMVMMITWKWWKLPANQNYLLVQVVDTEVSSGGDVPDLNSRRHNGFVVPWRWWLWWWEWWWIPKYLLIKYSSFWSLTPRYRPVVMCRILIGWYQLMNPPAHLVLASSRRHNERACDITDPPSYTTILERKILY